MHCLLLGWRLIHAQWQRKQQQHSTAATKGSYNLITVAKIQIHSRRCTAAQAADAKPREKKWEAAGSLYRSRNTLQRMELNTL